MDLIAIALNEKQIIKDGLIDLNAAKEEINNLFINNECEIIGTQGQTTVWSRNIDNHDSEILWQIQQVLEEKNWFKYYVSIWQYAATADNSDKVIEEGDILEEWNIQRPEKP
jgi:hypothetical protein